MKDVVLKRLNSSSFLKTVVDTKPLSYTPPPFPSLYWPFPISGPQEQFLYDARSIWKFTLYWTILVVVVVHLSAAGYACVVQYRNWRLIWLAPVVYLLIGGIEALIAGNVTGALYVTRDELLKGLRFPRDSGFG